MWAVTPPTAPSAAIVGSRLLFPPFPNRLEIRYGFEYPSTIENIEINSKSVYVIAILYSRPSLGVDPCHFGRAPTLTQGDEIPAILNVLNQVRYQPGEVILFLD